MSCTYSCHYVFCYVQNSDVMYLQLSFCVFPISRVYILCIYSCHYFMFSLCAEFRCHVLTAVILCVSHVQSSDVVYLPLSLFYVFDMCRVQMSCIYSCHSLCSSYAEFRCCVLQLSLFYVFVMSRVQISCIYNCHSVCSLCAELIYRVFTFTILCAPHVQNSDVMYF